jgi:serine phosphatase RsbU (regulator of sigma subunit)
MTGAAAGGSPSAGNGASRLPGSPRVPRRRPERLALLVGLVSLLVVGLLTWVTLSVYDTNEDRLLQSRARELGLVLQDVIPTIQTPLASAAALADATGGSDSRFRQFVKPYVGTGRPFVSASLWSPGRTTPIAIVGRAPLLASSRARAARFMMRTLRAPALSVTLVQSSRVARLGYGFSTPGNVHGYIIYAEGALAPNRRAAPAVPGSPFADVGYAIYLGRDRRRSNLLSTNLPAATVGGRHAATTVAFADRGLTVVVSPLGSLGGQFFARLPWLIAIVGTLLALTAAFLTDRLVGRRRRAEMLASTLESSRSEIRRLYHREQEIAQTLQQAILPEALPDLPGLGAAALYEPGTAGIDVGGDWYSLFDVGGGRVVALIGDVAGRGLQAATAMATLRTAAFSYAAQDSRPGLILARLARLVARQPDRNFATVLCMRVDVRRHEITLASAGHLPPLLLSPYEPVAYVDVKIGPPVGITIDLPAYEELVVAVAPGSTVVMFTDGLIERRREIIDVGLERLRSAAASKRRRSLEALVAGLAQELAPPPTDDDTAILAIRWRD